MVSESKSQLPRLVAQALPPPGSWEQLCDTELLSRSPARASMCGIWSDRETEPEASVSDRCLGGLGSHPRRKDCLLLRDETWERGEEVARVCPRSRSRGETDGALVK